MIRELDNVEGVPPGSYALLPETHHAAVDGVSGMEIMSALNDAESDAERPVDKGDWKLSPTRSVVASCGPINNVKRPMHFAGARPHRPPWVGPRSVSAATS